LVVGLGAVFIYLFVLIYFHTYHGNGKSHNKHLQATYNRYNYKWFTAVCQKQKP